LLVAQIWKWKEILGLWISFHNGTKPLFKLENMLVFCTSYSCSIFCGCCGRILNVKESNNDLVNWLLVLTQIQKSFSHGWRMNIHKFCVIFVTTNCTWRLQLVNVILQIPLKCNFANCFHQWLVASNKKNYEKCWTERTKEFQQICFQWEVHFLSRKEFCHFGPMCFFAIPWRRHNGEHP